MEKNTKTKSKKRVTSKSNTVSSKKKPSTNKNIVKKEVVSNKANTNVSNIKKVGGDKFEGNEIRRLLIIIGAVCAVMLAFYFITDIVLKNNKDKEENKKDNTVKIEPEIQYEKILMGSLLNQKQDNYYVLVYVEDEPIVEVYNQYIESYKKTKDPLKMYKVNLSEDFNKSYIAEESYLEGSDITKIKVKGTTLIRVSEGSILSYFEGSEAIINRFNDIIDLDN